MTNLEKYQKGNIVKCKGIDIQNSSNTEIVKILEIDGEDKYQIQVQKIEKNLFVPESLLDSICLSIENLVKLGFESNSDKTVWSNTIILLKSKATINVNENKNIFYQNNGGYEVVSIRENNILSDSIITVHALQNVYTEYFPENLLDVSSFYK